MARRAREAAVARDRKVRVADAAVGRAAAAHRERERGGSSTGEGRGS